MDRLPSLFLSHGAPTLALEDSPARRFLQTYGRTLGRPRAVLMLSAHYSTPTPTVTAAARPETIHDFGGFAPALYELTYPAPGDPELARHVAAMLAEAGLPAQTDPTRGLDHGAWVPLSLLYPDADVPVVQLSIDAAADPAHHHRLGQILRPLRDRDVLIIGSGSLTHNLEEFFRSRPAADAEPPGWVVAFADWIADRIGAGATDDLLHYRDRAPHAARNHPTDEHLLPLFAALGAGTPAARGERLHASHTFGVLAMDVYAFA
ncbi:MAG: DODA-type extradiol aromatic ring-opening family dioxygenase [Inquilinaceae bacterium]